MKPPNPNSSEKARQQIDEDLELISTLSYLQIQTAKSGDDKVTMSAPVLQHAGELIQLSGVNIEEMLDRV